MDLNIFLKKGLGEIQFGCTPELIRMLLGDPDEVEELENAVDNTVESVVWNYPDAGLNFFFDAANGEPSLCTIESDNIGTVLFNTMLFSITRDKIINLMTENGYIELEEDEESWGEHRVTFDDGQIDFYFNDQELTLVSWSKY